jgi:N-acetylmuramoyl-L-alanine amidase
MSRFIKRTVSWLIVLGVVGMLLLLRPPPGSSPPPHEPPPGKPPESQPQPPPTPPLPPALSVLGEMPDWTSLEVFQNTITRADFERLLTSVFTTGTAWEKFIEIDDAEARIHTGDAKSPALFHLRFASPGHASPTPRQWKSAAELPPAPPEIPLAGLRIAIDPGHIGGPWAQLEERWFLVDKGTPIREGDMTLTVAWLLKPRLESLGATVSLVRNQTEPVTPLRPENLLELARNSNDPRIFPAALQKSAERLFYRTAEIHARAKLVNQTLTPDLVLCLHFNAESWGNPHHPTLVTQSHLHLLLNGAYTDDEVALADQRFALLEKLLRRTHEEETLVATTVADIFAFLTGLPPFTYSAGSRNALPVNNHPYLWARNLLANRLYDCPVIFMEPYVMNSTTDSPRLQAGDYEGLRDINGTPQPSIFREYANALADALANHYANARNQRPHP